MLIRARPQRGPRRSAWGKSTIRAFRLCSTVSDPRVFAHFPFWDQPQYLGREDRKDAADVVLVYGACFECPQVAVCYAGPVPTRTVWGRDRRLYSWRCLLRAWRALTARAALGL